VLQEIDSDLGIGRARLNRRVTQDLAKRLQGGALPEHRRRGCVAKHPWARGGRTDACTVEGSRGGLPNHRPWAGPPRRHHGDEHAVDSDGWTSVFPIVYKRIANVLGARETGLTAAFTGHDARRILPVEIGAAPSDDITAPQSSTGHQHDDGLIASA
jgi:hypothetical protein